MSMNASNNVLHNVKNIKATKFPNIKRKKTASKNPALRKSNSKKQNVGRKKKKRKPGGKNV